MAQFDLKKATVRLCDGRLATLTTTAGAGVNAQLTLTDKDRHRGTRDPLAIRILNPGTNNASLSVSISGRVITVNCATDGSAAITSTATLIKAALEANADIAAVVTITLPGTGSGVVSAQAQTNLATGARTLTMKIADGTLSYTERKPRKYTKNRGELDTVMNADDEPLDARLDLILGFFTASSGGEETPRDVFYQEGEASDWVSTDDDQCQPFAVDIEVEYQPACSGVDDQFTMLKLFRFEELAANLKEGVLSVSGKCNVTKASHYRQTA